MRASPSSGSDTPNVFVMRVTVVHVGLASARSIRAYAETRQLRAVRDSLLRKSLALA
jgi:hypothetical protein